MKDKKFDSIINYSTEVKAYLYGNTLEMTTAKGPTFQSTQKIDKNRYVDLETGEIKYFEKNSSLRIDNLETIKKTMKKLRRLISHNFTGGDNQLWITLTFSEEVTDYRIASKDYKLFMKKIRRRYANLEYISVIEPQKSGRWHFHVLLKETTNKKLYISNTEINKIWGNGFTKTKRLKTTDKIGNYVTTYLTDLKIDDTNQTVKGARLHFYPKGIRIYRRSRNIENPLEFNDLKENIMLTHNIKNKQPNFSKETTYETRYGLQKYYTEFYDDLDIKEVQSNGLRN
ncbi:hypothetical protein G15_0099 [Enterococcus avium]|nr:hypothetical protein G15_0099 [Enterococcus avium]